MERKLNINTEECTMDVLAKLNSFRKESKYCDFVITTAERKSIPVHKCVVAASSEYFDAMLSHDTKETLEGVVEIHDAEESSIQKCVDFMYTGEASVSDEMQADALHVAHMFGLHGLYNAIALFLEHELDCATFFATRQLANIYGLPRLVSVCKEFALKNFLEIAQMEDFKKVEAEYLDFLLSADGLEESDRSKCKALMIWINYDSSRAASLFSLMKHIDLDQTPLTYRRFLVEEEAAVSKHKECLKLVMESICGEKAKSCDTTLNPRIVVFDHTSMKMRSLEVKKGIWTEMQDLHEDMRRSRSAVLVLEDYLYAFVSELNEGDQKNYRIKYRECDARWEAIAVRRGRWGRAVALNDYIYINDQDQDSNLIERYSPRENKWSFIARSEHVLKGSVMAVAAEFIYLLGGLESDKTTSTLVQMFNQNSSDWNDVGNLRQPRFHASAATLDDVIYIFGGYNPIGQHASNLEIFCASSNMADVVTLPNFARACFMCHSLDGIIYLVGGDRGQTATIGAYDLKTTAMTKPITMDAISMRDCESVIAFL